MKEITSDGFIGGSKLQTLSAREAPILLPWTKKGYTKKGGANSAVDAADIKKAMIATTIGKATSLGDMALNARKYIRDIQNASQAGRPWDTAQTSGTNYLLGREPIETLEGEAIGDQLAPQGYTGNMASNITSSQVNRLAQLRANNMLSRPPLRPGQAADDDAGLAADTVESSLSKAAESEAPEMLEDVIGDFGFGRKKRRATSKKRTSSKKRPSSTKKKVSKKKGGSLSSFLHILEDGLQIVAPEIYYPARGIYDKLTGQSDSGPVAFTRPKAPQAPKQSAVNAGVIASGRKVGGAKKEKSHLEMEVENETRVMKDAKRRYTTELSESAKDYRQQLIDEHGNLDWKDPENKKRLNAFVSDFKKNTELELKRRLLIASTNAYQEAYTRVRDSRVHFEGYKIGYGKKKKAAKKSVKKPTTKPKKTATKPKKPATKTKKVVKKKAPKVMKKSA